MADNHIILVDGNSIAHANHNANVLTCGDMQVQAIFGVLKSLRHLLSQMPGNPKMIVLWDGRAQWRIDLYPEYKANRAALDRKQEEHRAAFQRQTPFIEAALRALGVTQMRSPRLEADDLAGHLSRRMAAAGKQVTLVSGDRDWIGLVNANVSWYDPIRDRSVDATNFLDKTGYFTPEAFVQGKALQGDNSDNVEGIQGLGEKGAALFMAQWKDVRRFFAEVDAGTYTPKARGKGAKSLHPEQILASPEGRAIFERNLRLMDLTRSPTPAPGELLVQARWPNPAGFRQLCQRLAFLSILREERAFLRTFGIELKDAEAA